MNRGMTTLKNGTIVIAIDPNRPLEVTEAMIIVTLYNFGVEEPVEVMRKIFAMPTNNATADFGKVRVINQGWKVLIVPNK